MVNRLLPSSQGDVKVKGACHCEAFCAEAISLFGEEIASTSKERRFRNDIKQGCGTLKTPWPSFNHNTVVPQRNSAFS